MLSCLHPALALLWPVTPLTSPWWQVLPLQGSARLCKHTRKTPPHPQALTGHLLRAHAKAVLTGTIMQAPCSAGTCDGSCMGVIHHEGRLCDLHQGGLVSQAIAGFDGLEEYTPIGPSKSSGSSPQAMSPWILKLGGKARERDSIETGQMPACSLKSLLQAALALRLDHLAAGQLLCGCEDRGVLGKVVRQRGRHSVHRQCVGPQHGVCLGHEPAPNRNRTHQQWVS